MKTKLEIFLQKYINKKMPIIFGGGNRGDGLLCAGIDYICAYNSVGLNKIPIVSILGTEKLPHFKEMWVRGTGAYCNNWKGAIFLDKYISMTDKLVIFPSTFDTTNKAVEEVLKRLKKNTIIFCREKISYYNVQKVRPDIEIYLTADTSLYLLRDYKRKLKGKGKCYAFRNDGEKSNIIIPEKNKDLSSGSYIDWKKLLKDISRYREIHTNYGHVAIASTFMGNETYIYPGNYFKNEAFYDYMLKSRKNAHFIKKTEGKIK